MQAVEFLNEKEPGRKTILIFSDLKEDLEEGYVRDIAVPVEGFEVIAMNVTKLRSDNVDPREYLDRLEDVAAAKVEAEGGTLARDQRPRSPRGPAEPREIAVEIGVRHSA